MHCTAVDRHSQQLCFIHPSCSFCLFISASKNRVQNILNSYKKEKKSCGFDIVLASCFSLSSWVMTLIRLIELHVSTICLLWAGTGRTGPMHPMSLFTCCSASSLTMAHFIHHSKIEQTQLLALTFKCCTFYWGFNRNDRISDDLKSGTSCNLTAKLFTGKQRRIVTLCPIAAATGTSGSRPGAVWSQCTLFWPALPPSPSIKVWSDQEKSLPCLLWKQMPQLSFCCCFF